MPSELMDSHGLPPSSFLSEEVQERQIGFWKTDGMPDNYGGKAYVVGGSSLPLEKQMSSHFDAPRPSNFYLDQDHQHISLEGVGSGSQRPLGNFYKGGIRSNLNVMGENGLFSSSLSDIFSRKMRLAAAANNNQKRSMHGHSVGAYEEEEPFESLQEIEAQTIGNLLPDDDDLLSGVTDGIKVGDDVEELDLFSSVGGMELGEDGGGLRSYEIPQLLHSPHPSRTLFVRNINSNVEDSELQILFEQYGEIQTLYTACKHHGFVMISYYDIRAARRAMQALQNKPLRRRNLDIHYSIPKDNPSDKDTNQGIVVIYNLDPSISNDELRHVFGVYGEIKEIREGSSRHKSIEFYDVRAAESALRELNKSDMGAGKQIHIGASKRLNSPFPELLDPPPTTTRDICGVGMEHGSVSKSIIGGVEGMLKYDFIRNTHPHSLPDGNSILLCHSPTTAATTHLNGASRMSERVVGNRQFNRHSLELNSNNNDNVFSCSPAAAHQFMWNHQTPPPPPTNMMWPIAPRRNTYHHHHHVGSAPSVNPCIWDSPDTPSSIFHPPSLALDFVSPHNMFPPPNIGGLISHSHHQSNSSSIMFPSRGVFDSPSDRARSSSRRSDGSSNQAADNKKQFELDLDHIMRGEDRRTTLMIKNIPNKYTSKMLLAAIDERHRGTYDFIYLPIDFKNKCNVGYAFINMTEPSLIIPFYQAFNGKKWEKFNSEKVASLAYARIQGKAALIAHFQNSSLMNEDKRCRPILFHTDGPNAGDQVPFPMGVNVRSRLTKNNTTSRNTTTNEQDVAAPTASANGHESASSSNGGDSSSGSTKDFD